MRKDSTYTTFMRNSYYLMLAEEPLKKSKSSAVCKIWENTYIQAKTHFLFKTKKLNQPIEEIHLKKVLTPLK